MYGLKWSAVYYKFWDKNYASYREGKKHLRKRDQIHCFLKGKLLATHGKRNIGAIRIQKRNISNWQHCLA